MNGPSLVIQLIELNLLNVNTVLMELVRSECSFGVSSSSIVQEVFSFLLTESRIANSTVGLLLQLFTFPNHKGNQALFKGSQAQCMSVASTFRGLSIMAPWPI